MNYRFSKLFSSIEKDDNISITAHLSGAVIDLFEPAYVEEYRTLKQLGGADAVETELTSTLYREKVLVDKDADETDYLNAVIEQQEKDMLQFVIFPTEKCNLRCVYCYEKFKEDELSQAHYDLLADEILRRIEADNKKYVKISWFGGEPLLKLDDILRFNRRIKNMADVRDIAFYSGMTTNGVLLDTESFKHLCDSGLRSYQITLDGFLHDSQRKFPDGSGSFDIIFGNIVKMLESDLDFMLTVRINIADMEFDLSFYDLFSRFAGDKRLNFSVHAIGQWGECEFDLPLLEGGASDTAAIEKHNNYIRQLGLNVCDYYTRGLLSGACYASYRDMFSIRANGMVEKCTVALDEDYNDIGYLDLEKGEMVIDYNQEDQWSYSLLTDDCYNCKKLITCYNRSCPRNRMALRRSKCCG